MAIPTYDQYLATLGRVTKHVDPLVPTTESAEITKAAQSLALLPVVNLASVAAWITAHPTWVPALGLVVGLGQEKLKNALREHLGSQGWIRLAQTNASGIAQMLDTEFDLIASLQTQRLRQYSFADVLVARAGSRVTATSATTAGRLVEDALEAIAVTLGLKYAVRTRFEGRNSQTAPCDLAVPSGGATAEIVVAAKAFDSTGSKLSDAVREVEEMASVRKPTQFVFAVVDGIGWLSRQADLRKIHALWASDQIDGMYTLATLGQFQTDLEDAARRRRLLP